MNASSPDPVVIVGGGFSGTMLAARLAERDVPSVVIDRTGDFGAGVAYSTRFDGHLLNVRAYRMSAVEGRPADFVEWLRAHAPDRADPESFAPRRLYGRYVRDRLATVEAARPGLIRRVTGAVAAIEASNVRLADGTVIPGRAVILATGNPPPASAPKDAPAAVIPDPWAEGALDAIGREDDVLIIGAGLTAVDVLLSLDAARWRGHATALSRRGLLPRAHLAWPDKAATLDRAIVEGPASTRLAAARAQAAEVGWRAVMEGLRPVTAALWASADTATRARLVRHLRPWWDVHRHRIADSIEAVLTRLSRQRRLTVVAGRLEATRGDAAGVTVDWRPRRGPARPPLHARWLIDCTGPGHDPARDPLTGPLIASGRARLDPLRLGLDLDSCGRVLDASGEADPRLFVLGPPARAAFWETIAVPDIRKRIEVAVDALAELRP